jgi:hypothetical protein
MNGQLNDYKSGYKQCLIDIENLIDKQLLEMEKEQIKDAYNDGHTDGVTAKPGLTSGTMYYNETYGGDK